MNYKLLYSILNGALCFSAILLSNCNNKDDLPYVSDDQLARITADLFIVEGATANLSGNKKDSLYLAYAAQVFELRGIAKELYEKKLMEVAFDLGRMENMAIKVEDLLKAEQQAGKPLDTQDSIKSIK